MKCYRTNSWRDARWFHRNSECILIYEFYVPRGIFHFALCATFRPKTACERRLSLTNLSFFLGLFFLFFLLNCFFNFGKLIYKVKFPAFFSDKKVCYNKKYKKYGVYLGTS